MYKVRFNLTSQKESGEALSYLLELTQKGKQVEVKKISPRRSLNQNAYLHLLISAFALHFGYSLEEAKQLYKEVNASIYKYKKKGRTFWRSSADLTKEEMAQSIDAFMQRSAEHGYPLPLATQKEWLQQIENEIERSSYYVH